MSSEKSGRHNSRLLRGGNKTKFINQRAIVFLTHFPYTCMSESNNEEHVSKLLTVRTVAPLLNFLKCEIPLYTVDSTLLYRCSCVPAQGTRPGFFGKGDGSMWNHNDSENPFSSSIVLCSSQKAFFALLATAHSNILWWGLLTSFFVQP